MVGTGWRHCFLCHAPPPPRHPRHVQGPAKVLASQGAPNSFFPPRPGAVPAVWFAAARGTAAVQRARARRLYSPRARRQHCSSTASWCGLQLSMQHCSTGHNKMLQSARPSIAPTRTAYILHANQISILRYLSLSRLDIHLPSFVLTISQNILA